MPELKVSQELDQSRGAELLDRIGPAVVMAHSLGGPAGWLIADARPDLVKALVEIEADRAAVRRAPRSSASRSTTG